MNGPSHAQAQPAGKSTIALDAMSGDAGADVVVDAAARAVEAHPELNLLLVGDPSILKDCLSRQQHKKDLQPLSTNHFDIVAASEVVSMDDSVSTAMRLKKDSSMRVAINLVKEGRAAACVSAGNTAALVAISRFVLKTLPGVDRPAISTTIPTINGHTHMLDLGANVDSSGEHLHQFAVMGSILANVVDSVDQPRIGLLNIGSEELKGNEQVKDAARHLQDSDLNYIGFVEGNEIYTDSADVIVCDGFVGNVSLKTSEGVASLVKHFLEQEFRRTPLNKVIGLLAKPILLSFRNRIDPRRYNGASLLGLRGVVIKSHGGVDDVAFANAIKIAHLEIAKNVPEMIRQRLETLLPQV